MPARLRDGHCSFFNGGGCRGKFGVRGESNSQRLDGNPGEGPVSLGFRAEAKKKTNYREEPLHEAL